MQKLKVGDKMPNFTVDTVTNSGVAMTELVGGKPTMFMVLRYIGCTVCRYDVHMLAQRYKEFSDKGVNVVVVMQSTREIVLRDLAGQVLPFQFICDPSLTIYKELEIEAAADMKALGGGAREAIMEKVGKATEVGFAHGDYEGIEEQLPAFFYVDAEMNVLEAHYGKALLDMPTIDDMLAKIK